MSIANSAGSEIPGQLTVDITVDDSLFKNRLYSSNAVILKPFLTAYHLVDL